jgi:hypothetical protein
MQKCTRCDAYVRFGFYPDTGDEFYCSCQNTLQAEFDKNLWINMEETNEINNKETN